jgi:hypothetical protein
VNLFAKDIKVSEQPLQETSVNFSFAIFLPDLVIIMTKHGVSDIYLTHPISYILNLQFSFLKNI